MKKFLVFGVLLISLAAAAQPTKDDIALIQSMYGKDKRDLMQEYLQISDSAKATAFWKLYDSYEADRKKLAQDYIAILEDYAKSYEGMDDKKADELVNKASANNIAYENLYLKYYKKIKPVIGGLKASQFFQLEAYMRNTIRSTVSDQIPFIGEIDRKKMKVTQ